MLRTLEAIEELPFEVKVIRILLEVPVTNRQEKRKWVNDGLSALHGW